MGRRHGRGQPDDDAGQHALEAGRPRHRAENAQIDWTFRVGDQVKIRLVNEMDSDHPMPHPFHVHGAGRFLILARDGVVEPNLVWKDTVLVRTGETVDILLDVTNPGRLDGPLPHRRAPRERNDVQLQRRSEGLVSVAAVAQPVRAGLRAPVLWGLAVGVAQAATPLAFWWLDTATVYALGIVVIASVYIGFAVADGRRTVLAVEIGVASMFVIIAAAAITGTPWLLVVGLAGHGLKDLWQHRRQFVANTRWWPPFCLVVDWAVAAIIAVEIAVGVHFHH